MEQTARTLYNKTQIRVHWTFQEPIRKPPRDMLRIGTEGDMIVDLAWAKGSGYQAQVDKLFDSSAQRLSSIGQPIAVFIVEEVGYDGVSGASSPGVIAASAGPFVDWIAVEASRRSIRSSPEPAIHFRRRSKVTCRLLSVRQTRITLPS